ncbi:MAG: Uncharacterized protein conserved in bacteria [uncultured Rubrobacteraceae bacterium]|uniref:Uncharacterized protein conserved in bacteria n=1 Tax=uncultured Rubrobacteraceae bacterium TaxID=349277 RepID=A0A6J4QYI5_9ACTN|nr:MAG: Uncharacterized protein conserved in bacteria [uncultured Rubrobacteraceae bacterium]
MPMKVVSLNVALPSTQCYDGRKVLTGGAKRPVPRAMLRYENFEGDGQGDQENHGGPDKAVCVYPLDHYPHWEKELGGRLLPGAMSENLTVSGALETGVCIGDVFKVGEATVKISQPRMPCHKLAGKNGERLLAKWVSRTGYTGFYTRVLSEGMVSAGEAFELVERHLDRISVADVNEVIYERSRDFALIERLAGLPELAADWRAMFAGRLERVRRQRQWV